MISYTQWLEQQLCEALEGSDIYCSDDNMMPWCAMFCGDGQDAIDVQCIRHKYELERAEQ